ncbi:MAG: leucine-rich repeat protein, partial [Clostridia bacterium]|nr:leucine-rich repeat protein [Clostridia bacterium]
MKKSLSLLALSLLLVVAMILGVSAKVTESDIGIYIRFDSQEDVDTYAADSTYTRVVYDAEKNALRLTSLIPVQGTLDANAWFKFGQAFNIADYPYFRMSYMIPTVGVNGKIIDEDYTDNGIHLWTSDGPKYRTFQTNPRDTKRIFVHDMSTLTGTINQVRTDAPNNAQIGEYYEYYIYDIGLFKTAEAASAYNPGLEYYYLDMTDPQEYTKWTANSQCTMTYSEELGATVFTHAKWLQEEQEKGADARLSGRSVAEEDWFPVQNYPVYSWKYKTNITSNAIYLLDTAYNGISGSTLTAGGLGTGLAKNNLPFAAPVADEWNIGYDDLSAKTTGLFSVKAHAMDPYNVIQAEGTEYVAWKYIAYFKDTEAAAKGVTYEPTGIEVIPATSASGKATITGVDSTMEYTTNYDGTGYVAVEGDTITADTGKAYYIRYAATETTNPSNPVAVGVPHYCDVTITAVKNANGEVIENATINHTDDGIVINVPFGTNTKELILNWTLETSVAATGRSAASLYVNGDYHETKVPILPSEAVDLTQFTDEDGDVLALYYSRALYEYINLKINVEDGGKTEAELAQLILDAVTADGVNEYDLLGAANDVDAQLAIFEAAKIASFRETFAGSEIGVIVDDFSAPTKGTAADPDGEDGSVTYKITVKYGEATVESEPVTLTVPAQHFRVLWKFNDQEFADEWKYNSNENAVTKTENGSIPVITENGETFARFEITASNPGGVYIEYKIKNNTDYGDIYNGAEYQSFFRTEDYPYTVVYYRSNGALPDTSSNTTVHIYYTTDDLIKGNHYDYAPVPEGMQPNPDPGAIDLTINPGGSYLGYRWSRNLALWSGHEAAFPKNTQEWKSVIINNNGGTEGVTQTGAGYRDGNYVASGVKYPWSGNVLLWRIDPYKNSAITEGTVDIMAVAFFSDLEDAQNFDFSVINPFTASEKATIDALTLKSANSALVTSEDEAFADAKAKLEAQLADFDGIAVEKVSYTPADNENGVDGSITVKVTVANGTQLGDRDIYSVNKTMAISALDVEIVDMGKCGESVNWAFDTEGTLTIGGTGDMYDWNWISSLYAPWESYSTSINNIVISDGVTSIGNFAFTDCINLVNVDISNSVKSIGSWAFAGCEKLVGEINLSDVETIGEQAFFSCRELTGVTLSGSSDMEIGAFAFAGCNGLVTASFSASAEKLHIDGHAFFACTELESVSISGDLCYVEIGEHAFSECRSLTNVYYVGSKEELYISDNNDSLTNAEIHYNYGKTYDVIYDANGGSGAPSSQTKVYDEALTLSSIVPTRSGCIFKGWATSSIGSVVYAPGASYTANADVTLYAVWESDTYTVSYNANDGSGAPSSQTKIHGEALTLSSTVPARSGYTFKGWATSVAGS